MAMLIQSFTGMRIGEIVPLKYKNLKDLECLNINYLEDTKTKKHNRLIPIHKTLKRELIKYFEENNIRNDDDNLFKMKKLNNNVNKQIKKQIDIINKKITTKEDKRAYKTSHKFRYKFIQELNHHHQELANYITVLCGHTSDADGKYHKKSNNINFDLYNKGKANWDVLVKMIHCFDFDIK
jgi:integrase